MKPDDAPLGALGSFFALFFFLATLTGALFFADCYQVAMTDKTEHTRTGFRQTEYLVSYQSYCFYMDSTSGAENSRYGACLGGRDNPKGGRQEDENESHDTQAVSP